MYSSSVKVVDLTNRVHNDIMYIFKGRAGRRLRFIVLLTLITFCAWLGLHSPKNLETEISTKTDNKFEIVKEREHFRNPVFLNWGEIKGQAPESNCLQYWNRLLKLPVEKLESPHPDFDLDPSIYKKSKWMINAKTALRRALHEQGKKMDDGDLEELQANFYEHSEVVSQLEEYFVNQIAHLRVLGKSLYSDLSIPLDLTSENAKSVISYLLPWLKDTATPLDELLVRFKKKHGILITILPSSKASIQVDRISRLIRVLRVQGNQLPVQIAFAGAESMVKQKQDLLIRVASADSDSYKQALDERDSGESITYPKQELSFLNVAQYLSPETVITDNIVYSVAVMFSDFENVIVLNSQTIPMTEDLSLLFANDQFQSQGMFFFKDRPSVDSRPEPFPSGFFEVNELVNKYAVVGENEIGSLGMKIPKNVHTKRVSELGFQRLTDPSMAVFNKKKAGSGLLISSVLPFHSVLKPKFDLSTIINPELLWLGQELAGLNDYVHFNSYFASAPGILTPAENLPPDWLTSEICSSSWSQISGDNEKLLYVTSHQLENRVLPTFKEAIWEKLSVKIVETDGKEVIDSSLAQETVARNLLFIKSILQPISVENVFINDEGQPFVPSERVDEFGSTDDYWCSYDIIGSSDSPKRGLVYNFSEDDVRRFLFYLDVWLQFPVPDKK